MTRARNSANLASHGNLFVDIANDRTGIGSVVPAQNLHVAGTAGFHADVTFTGDLYNTTWDRSANTLRFNDNALLRFGTGTDANIRHDGSNTWIQNGTGYLYIDAASSNGIRLISQSHWQQGAMAAFYPDSSVVLYHDASSKFSTEAYGTNTTGTAVNDGLVVAGVATVTTMNVTGVLTYDDVTSVDSVGIVTARQGVHIDDSITHIGDTDTKIRFPQANAINLETGGTSRLSIDTSGNVTISGNLTVTGTTTQNNTVATTTKVFTLASGSANNAAADGAGILIDAGSDTDKTLKWLDSTDRWTFTGGDVAANAFYGDGQNITGNTIRPNLTFNTSSGGLDVTRTNGNTSATFRGTGGAGSIALVDTDNGKIVFLSNSDGDFNIQTSGSSYAKKVTVTPAGLVGIATHIPSAAFLDIASADATDSLRLRRLSSDSNVASNWSLKPYAGMLFFRHGGSTDRVRFDETAGVKLMGSNQGNHMSTFGTNVGGLIIDDVGHSHTGLQVSHGSNNVFLIASSNNSVYLSSYGTGNFILEHTGDGTLTRERLRITSIGDIYAGNADTGGYAIFDNSTLRPKYQFRQGTGHHRGFAIIETRGDANGQDVFIAKSREGNGTGLINAGDQLGRIQFAGADGTNMVNGATIFGFTESTKTVAANRMPTNLSFRTHDDNTSGTVERLRITYDGKVVAGGSGAGYPCKLQSHGAGDLLDLNSTSGAGKIRFYESGSGRFNIETMNGSSGLKFYDSLNAAERMRITSTGKIGVNYAGTPPEETFMIRPASDETVSRLTLSHLSSGNSYGARISTIGGASKGFDLATQFNSSYITRARMTDRGVFQLSPSNDISSIANSFLLNLGTTYSGSYPVYSGLTMKNFEANGGNGMAIHTTSGQWDLYTNAGSRYGLSIAHNTNASSGNSRFYLTHDGYLTVGTNLNARLSTSRKGHTRFHVVGGGISIGPNGNTGTTQEGGRYVLGWYMVTHTTSNSYTHLITDLWAGGSPHGNNEYIMGGFHIHGHQYSGGSSVSRERIYFHNWSGSYPGLSNSNPGNWSAGSAVYTNSAGYVTLRLSGGSYRGYIIDLVQHAWYPTRDMTVTTVTTSDSSTL